MTGPVELMAAVSLLALMIVLKFVNVTRYRFDSDEPQHMHVIWAWARGFVQYRDVFDNHMPLFHIMFAPIFGLIGDRASILCWMRYILLPMYFVGAWCTYRIGELLFSRRAGIWAVILVGLYPSYHSTSFEFRPDNLLAPLWLLCITTLLRGPLTLARALISGLLLGLCFSVSMKSVLLFPVLLASAAIALLLVSKEQSSLLPTSWMCVGAGLLVALLPPAAVALAFRGVWRDFYYCNFEHDVIPHVDAKTYAAWWIVIFALVLGLAIYLARIIVRAAPGSVIAFRRGFIFLACGVYLLVLHSFYVLILHTPWYRVPRQNYLPFFPLGFVLVSGGLLAISPHLEKYSPHNNHYLRRLSLPAFIALVELTLLIITRPPWINGARLETNLLRSVLKVTDPGDWVLDCKGETIFRQRSFWPVTERVTLQRLALGLMTDNGPERAVETRTCVAVMEDRMPRRTRKFIWENYVPVGDGLRVAGRVLKPSRKNGGRIGFEVVIPARYKIVAREGSVTGTLDGMAYDGDRARFLAPGKHTFAPTSSRKELAFLWAQAVDRNFLPEEFSHPSGKQ